MRIEGETAPPLPNGERVAAKRPGEGAIPAKRKDGATERARRLRTDETEAEYRLWGELRGRYLNGYKFVRQIPLGPYVVDFVCRRKRLVIEVDGSQHAESAGDFTRTAWLNDQGYSVLRFWNDEVLRERRAVLETFLGSMPARSVAPSFLLAVIAP
ncbi:MAG: endonuclease domain-containing protein [Rhizobiales bacterium]|nr:endonuclease domain-containing protein [Hyphomicrobiales bacterium]